MRKGENEFVCLQPFAPHASSPATTAAPSYDELRLRVKTHEQQNAAIARVDREARVRARSSPAHTPRPRPRHPHLRVLADRGPTRNPCISQERIERAERAASRAAEAAEAERLETERLRAELATALQRAQQQRRTTVAAEAALRAHLGAQCDERLREERARAAQELVLLREAAAADAEVALAGHVAELDVIRGTRTHERLLSEAQAHEATEAQRQHSAKHAERLRAVISSEEACQAQCEALHGRLRSLAQTALALAARKRWAEVEARAWTTGAHALRRDVAPLEAELEASERARSAAAVAHERQLAGLEGAVEEMRVQCHPRAEGGARAAQGAVPSAAEHAAGAAARRAREGARALCCGRRAARGGAPRRARGAAHAAWQRQRGAARAQPTSGRAGGRWPRGRDATVLAGHAAAPGRV